MFNSVYNALGNIHTKLGSNLSSREDIFERRRFLKIVNNDDESQKGLLTGELINKQDRKFYPSLPKNQLVSP